MTVMEAGAPPDTTEVAGRGLAEVPAEHFEGVIPQKMVGAVKMLGANGMSMPAKPLGGAIDIKDAKFLKCKDCGPVEGTIVG